MGENGFHKTKKERAAQGDPRFRGPYNPPPPALHWINPIVPVVEGASQHERLLIHSSRSISIQRRQNPLAHKATPVGVIRPEAPGQPVTRVRVPELIR